MAMTPTGADERALSPMRRFVLKAATLRHDGDVTRVHVVAEGKGWALVYSADRLWSGAPVVLTLDSTDIPARVTWCDGLRARLDTTDGTLLAELGRGSLLPEADPSRPDLAEAA